MILKSQEKPNSSKSLLSPELESFWREKRSSLTSILGWFVLLFCIVGILVKFDLLQHNFQSPDILDDYPWLFLREGDIPEPGQSISLIAVGDIMLGRGTERHPQVFRNVAKWISTADLAFGNLEGVIISSSDTLSDDQNDPSRYPIFLNNPPVSAALLQEAGFDLIGLANNHALDQGSEGLINSIESLERVGLSSIGASASQKEAFQPVFRTVRGVKLAFLAFNAIPNPENLGLESEELQGIRFADWDDGKVEEALQTAQDQADVVVVSVHWGTEYDIYPGYWQQKAAKDMVKAGADFVFGHHPHVVQRSQVLEQDELGKPGRKSFVAYSLGNFVFDQYEERTDQGLALRIFFDKDGLQAVQALPVWSAPRPRLMSLAEMDRAVEIVQPSLKRLGYECNSKQCSEVGVPEDQYKGIFQEGQIDLTGDGKDELILVNKVGESQDEDGNSESQQVTILQDGTRVWQSPIDWHILDLALGDPNQDGRFEIISALEKADSNDVKTSHPFIIGYRGGKYRDVWGGSAVADPILELELGDVDGDGEEELVVLEERGDGSKQAVAVWKWNGWGYSLMWRSPEGRYQDLVLLPGQNNKSIISVAVSW